ncbi:MAG TPA: hypothetical protein VI603_18145 [Saprospiraceae bacterium]|nr:hypothetical protein [Saprospiraceae bacterium]
MKHLCNTLTTVLCLVVSIQIASAQEISVYQYRHVPQDNVDEFLYRETTYWQKVAQKAIDDGKMNFWALLEKVSGTDLTNSSNFLFINTFENIDAEGIWNPGAVFPGVPMGQMETGSMSTVTSQVYVQPQNWVDDAAATPEKDYNYVVINYWNSSDPGAWIEGENTHWAPFIKAEMAKAATSQVAWGNATILAPRGGDVEATNISFDLFSTLHSALIPKWDPNTKFPEEALAGIQKTLLSPRGLVVYRIVAVATKNE